MWAVYKLVNDLWLHEGTFDDVIQLTNCVFYLGRDTDVKCINVKRV